MDASRRRTVLQLEALSRRLGTFVEVDEDDSWCDAVEQLSVNSESLLRDYVTALDALKYDGTELAVSCVHVHVCVQTVRVCMQVFWWQPDIRSTLLRAKLWYC